MQRLTVLIYHRVLAHADPMFPDIPDAAAFARHVVFYKRFFKLLPLSEAVDRLGRGKLEGLSACITFDDGYADNAEVALPILSTLQVPATFFVSTGFLNGGCMWNDLVIEAVRNAPGGTLDLTELGLPSFKLDTAVSRRSAVDRLLDQLKYKPLDERAALSESMNDLTGGHARPLMMSDEQVRILRVSGMEIGAHTRSHPILTRIDARSARQEICESKTRLEDILRERVGLFAYPNGQPRRDYNLEHVAMVREAGYDCAVSTATGVATPRVDPFQIPRLQPWPRTLARLGVELALNLRRTQCEFV